MINWSAIFNPRGLNYWLIGSALGWNLLANSGLLILAFQVLKISLGGNQLIQVMLIVGVFLISLLGGFVTGRMAGDGRGPAYGVYGSFSSVILIVYVLVPSGGLLGIIMAVSTILGGLNGGLLSARASR